MKTKFLSFLVAFLVFTSLFSQSNLNNYKYVLIPIKYDFLTENDQFQLNSLTEFLFNKYGFEAFMNGEILPEELNKNRCLALNADVIDDSGMFVTKLTIELKDCNGATVYTTKIGESREKEYEKSYSEALRDAFDEIIALNHTYKPSENFIKESKQVEPVQNEVAQEIEQLKLEIENLKQEKETPIVTTEVPKATVPVVSTSIIAKEVSEVAISTESISGVLYAQAIENGFQLVDSSPKVVYKMKKTGMDNVFLVEDKNATLYKKGDNWILEYYENNVLKQEVLNIKF